MESTEAAMPNTSICEDVKSNDVGLYKAIKKNKLKTFTSMLATEKFAVKDKEVFVRANLIVICLLGYLWYEKNLKSAWKISWSIHCVHSHGLWLPLLEKKINLVNQIPADAARVYDDMCMTTSVWHHPPTTNRFRYVGRSIWLCLQEDYIQ